MTALEVRDLTVRRGAQLVLDRVDLDVAQGAITALLGPNGAGKTTVVQALLGLVHAETGVVRMHGQELPAVRRLGHLRRAGLTVLPEGHRVLTTMTVADNLRAAVYRLPRRSRSADIDRLLAIFPELEEKLTSRAGSLSGGQQQMLALAASLAGRPRVLVVDELSLGLAPVVVARLMEELVRLTADGVGILLIEQFTSVALGVAAHACVLSRGRICFSGSPADLTRDPQMLHEAYLGHQQAAASAADRAGRFGAESTRPPPARERRSSVGRPRSGTDD